MGAGEGTPATAARAAGARSPIPCGCGDSAGHPRRSAACPGGMAQQVGQELDHLRTPNRAGKQPKVKVPPGHARHRRQRLTVEVVLQHRRLSSWRPGTAAVRPLAQSAFIDEDDRAALVLGFFLMWRSACASSGNWLFPSRSRALARPGRWQLHPNCRRIRHACPGWYWTPHSVSIRCATRADVHRLFSYPSASGPCPSARVRCAASLRGANVLCVPHVPPASPRPQSTLLELLRPAADRLPMCPHPASHLSLVNTVAQQFGRPTPPLL